MAADCTGSAPGGPCPAGLVRVGSGVTACTPRCSLETTDREYAACPQGFMCSNVSGCFLTCGTSACYPGERCNSATMRCERETDAGSPDVVTQPVDAGTQPVDVPTRPIDVPSQPVDVPSQPVDVPSQPVDVPSQPVDVPSQPVDVPSQPVDVPSQPVDSGMAAASCSMGLPTSGTTMFIGSGNGTQTALRLAVNDTHVAWSDGANITLLRADGVTEGTLARPGVEHIALTATHLYYAIGGASSSISRVPLAGFATAMHERIRDATAFIPSFALGPDGILWAQESASGAAIFRADLDGQRAAVRGEVSYRSGGSERIVDMGVAGGVLYVALRASLGTSGCFRVVRFDAGPTMPSSPEPTVVYGPTSSGCTAATWANLAFDGANVFFHSSSPPEVVQYAPGGTASRFAAGFGDGTFLGVTPRCLIGVSGGLFGISRALPINEARIPLGFNGTPLGRIAVRGPFVYGFVMNRSLYSVFRYGL